MENFYPGSGTTLCPHCGTRFKVAKIQLEAHHGMVRCGHCLQAFDTRPNFAPEDIDPQLELPMLDELEAQAEELLVAPPDSQKTTSGWQVIARHPAELPAVQAPEPAAMASAKAVLQPSNLADQTASFMPELDVAIPSNRHSILWAMATLPLLLLLLAQTIYLFRVELAARLPVLKPALIGYCRILKCSVPLPQKVSLMSIESSELKDDPAHRNKITLGALLRNRAAYTQAFPNLELTLTDSQDKALARRIFSPRDYLSKPGDLTVGLPANQELNVKLHLDTTDLKPLGYRLVLFYSND